ncbi:MAG: hypothetical protein WAS05_01800 [Candidatus Nanopelagicales bacterium]
MRRIRMIIPMSIVALGLSTLAVGAQAANAQSPDPTSGQSVVTADGCPSPNSVTTYQTFHTVELFGRKGWLQGFKPKQGSFCVWGYMNGVAIAPGDRVWVDKNGHDMTSQGGYNQVQKGQKSVWTHQAFRDGPNDKMNVCIKAGNRPNIRCSALWLPSPADDAIPTQTATPVPSASISSSDNPLPTESASSIATSEPTEVPSPSIKSP